MQFIKNEDDLAAATLQDIIFTLNELGYTYSIPNPANFAISAGFLRKIWLEFNLNRSQATSDYCKNYDI